MTAATVAENRITTVATAIYEAVQATKADGIPSGHLYAAVMSACTLSEYETIIATFVNAGFMTLKNNVLTAR